MQIGYIGLGLMGGAICRNLVRSGKFEVKVFDNHEEKIKAVEAAGPTAHGVKSIEELVDCDVLITSLPTPKIVLGVMTGEKGLMTHMKKGSVYIDVSTIDPKTAEELEAYGKKYGVGFLGCPQGKGPAQAEKGEQPIFVGGDKEIFDRMKPVLDVISNDVHYMKGARQAYAFKIISNMVGMTNLAVLAEGIHLAEKAGLDLEQFEDLLATTGADSAQLHMRGEAMRTKDFHNKFGVDLALKDVRLGCGMADNWDYDARFTKLAEKFYAKASEAGYGREDCCAVYKSL